MAVSNKQSQGDGELRSLKSNNEQLKQVSRVITEMIYGQRTPEEALTKILSTIQ